MAREALMLVLAVAGLASITGCESLGSCSLTCYGQSGNIYHHGPYENYSRGECDDQAEQSSTPIAPCVAEWDPY